MPSTYRYLLALLLSASFTTTVRADASAPQFVVAPADTSSVPLPAASKQAAAVSDPFAKGSRYWSVTAGGSRNASIARVYFTQINVSYYLVDNLAIDCGGIFGYADAKRAQGGVIGGPELGVRWHVAKGKRWSTYMEGVAGALFQQHPLTEQSLRFNFDLQPGVGATCCLSKNTVFQGGFRWHHLSNARIHGKVHNFGYDGPLLYLELMRSF